MYLQTDGTIEFPNSFEGDLLKIAYGTAVQSIKQPQLNPNQQIVLDWLKEKYTVTNIEPIELFWRLRVNSIKPDYRGRPVYRSYRYMSKLGNYKSYKRLADGPGTGESGMSDYLDRIKR